MEQALIDKICAGLYISHPEIKGIKPKITKKTEDQFLFLFKQIKKTNTGMDISQVVRVTVTNQGKILKISSSRG